jgi:MYXO-CTERM domain-containing protein
MTIGYAGAVIDDGDACFEPGGPAASMRAVTGAGKDGDLVWTKTTADPQEANYGQWHFDFEHAGRYKLEIYTDAAYAQSKQAMYVVQAAGVPHDMVVDQTAVDGWQTLGEFDFAQGPNQFVKVGDNTGEPLADNVQLAFDAVRLMRIETDDGSGSGSDVDPGQGGGCAVGSDLGVLMVAALVGLRRRRPINK